MSISCIIVNYNNKHYLERAVVSVLSQTLVPDEIIIADDASIDGSVRLIKQLAVENSQISPIFRKNNIGVSANRDLAIRSSMGKYFTTLDSDDWFYPTKIEKEYSILKNSLSAIACSDIDLVKNEIVFDTIKTGKFCSLVDSAEKLNFLISRKKGMPRDMMIPKELYLNAGGMDHKLTRYEDWDLKIRFADQDINFIHSGVIGMAYRREGSGLSSVNQVQHTFDKLRVLLPTFFQSENKSIYIRGMINLFLYKGIRKIFRLRKTKNEII